MTHDIFSEPLILGHGSFIESSHRINKQMVIE